MDWLLSGNTFWVSFCIKNAVIIQIGQKIKVTWLINPQIAKKIEVNNAIVDDLEAMGVEDDTVMFIMGRAREINKKPFYTSGEDFVDIIKEELDFQGIDYDVEFYKNYFRELTGLMWKPEPRFMYGGIA